MPADHFVSGAILGAFGSAAFAFDKLNKGEISSAKFGAHLLKGALIGGVSASTAIYASNCIANRRYLSAASSVALGLSGVLLIEKIKI